MVEFYMKFSKPLNQKIQPITKPPETEDRNQPSTSKQSRKLQYEVLLNSSFPPLLYADKTHLDMIFL